MIGRTRLNLTATALTAALLIACAGKKGALTSPPAGGTGPRTAASDAPPPAPPRHRIPRQRGVSWVAGPRPVTAEMMSPLVEHNVEWIVQTPFGWQQRTDSPEVRLVTEGKVFWGETDEGLRVTTRLARERGIRTLLKPHIWLTDAGGAWRSDIAMASEEDWRAWFDSYRRFILHYARLADELGIEGLAVGTELRSTLGREEEWRSLIAEIRQSYGGFLTYAANWWREVDEVPFWEQVDAIGVQGYYPLEVAGPGGSADSPSTPTAEQLAAAWRPHRQALADAARRHGRPVLFTEVGYKSTTGTHRKPWEWLDHRRMEDYPVDMPLQAAAYEAFFRTFWQEEWFAGSYVWKWHPAAEIPQGVSNPEFSPQGKPAARVMRRWYGRDRPAATTGQ